MRGGQITYKTWFYKNIVLLTVWSFDEYSQYSLGGKSGKAVSSEGYRLQGPSLGSLSSLNSAPENGTPRH